jgi:hypothetical protein
MNHARLVQGQANNASAREAEASWHARSKARDLLALHARIEDMSDASAHSVQDGIQRER